MGPGDVPASGPKHSPGKKSDELLEVPFLEIWNHLPQFWFGICIGVDRNFGSQHHRWNATLPNFARLRKKQTLWISGYYFVCQDSDCSRCSSYAIFFFGNRLVWVPAAIVSWSFASSSGHFPSVLGVKCTIITLGLSFRELTFISDYFVCRKFSLTEQLGKPVAGCRGYKNSLPSSEMKWIQECRWRWIW